MLKWELLFLRKFENRQEIMFSRVYQNGKPVQQEIPPEKEILVNYVSLFPRKDVVRIKMGVTDRTLYSFFYINKMFYDLGFLGVLGVSEFQEKSPYDWNDTEIIAKFIFAEYFTRLRNGKLLTLPEAQAFIIWMDNQISEYYLDFLDSKEEYYKALQNATRSNLQKTFRIEMDLEKEIGYDPQEFSKKVEIQVISSVGTPITRIITLIDGKYNENWSNEEEIVQNLEGMSYSALQTFIIQQNTGMNLQVMKVRKPSNKGFEFLLFKQYEFNNKLFLVILNVENFYKTLNIYIDYLLGYENNLLIQMIQKFDEHKNWFENFGQISSKQEIENLEQLIIDHCQDFFANISSNK